MLDLVLGNPVRTVRKSSLVEQPVFFFYILLLKSDQDSAQYLMYVYVRQDIFGKFQASEMGYYPFRI